MTFQLKFKNNSNGKKDKVVAIFDSNIHIKKLDSDNLPVYKRIVLAALYLGIYVVIKYLLSTGGGLWCGYKEEKISTLKSFLRIIHTQIKDFSKIFSKIG